MHRAKFPERVPFRLTRMLVNAMEVAGIEGNFRSTCEKVLLFVFTPLKIIKKFLGHGNSSGKSRQPSCYSRSICL
jgi:hypothetical protein